MTQVNWLVIAMSRNAKAKVRGPLANDSTCSVRRLAARTLLLTSDTFLQAQGFVARQLYMPTTFHPEPLLAGCARPKGRECHLLSQYVLAIVLRNLWRAPQ